MRLEPLPSNPDFFVVRQSKNKECATSSITNTDFKAQHMSGYSETLLSAPSHSSMISTSCPGTCESDILYRYPVKECASSEDDSTLLFMTISCVFQSSGDVGWSLEELRLQDCLNRQRLLSAGSTRGANTPTPNDNKPSGCFIIVNGQNISISG